MTERLPVWCSAMGEVGALARLLPLVAVLSACSGVAPAQRNPFPWNPGLYEFSGTLSWSNDTFSGERIERRQVSGTVRIDTNGPVTVTSQDGPCGAPEPNIVRADELRGTHSVRCGTALFTFWRQRARVGVAMRADVHETKRRRGDCVEYEILSDGREFCARYEYRVESAWVSRSATISTVVRVER